MRARRQMVRAESCISPTARRGVRMERALTVRDVAREYGVTADTVYRWIRGGVLRPIRLPGGDYRFRREHLAEFDERCRVPSESASDTISDEEPRLEFGKSAGTTGAPDLFRRGRELGRLPSSDSQSSSPASSAPQPHKSPQ